MGPRDAAVMEAILKEMGVEDYEPNVIHQMLEFTYSKFYVTTITVELAQKKALKTESFILCSVLIFEDIIMTLYSRLRPFVCSSFSTCALCRVYDRCSGGCSGVQWSCW